MSEWAWGRVGSLWGGPGPCALWDASREKKKLAGTCMSPLFLSSSCKDHEATLLLKTLCTLYRLGLGLRLGNI